MSEINRDDIFFGVKDGMTAGFAERRDRPRVTLRYVPRPTLSVAVAYEVTGLVNTLRWEIGSEHPADAVQAWIDAGEVDVEIRGD